MKTGEQKQLYGGYYPIAEYGPSFVFAGKSSRHGKHDQIYRGFADGGKPVSLVFNMDDADTSDPFPVGDGLYFVSSTRGTPQGIYKLFLADANSSAVIPLSEINPRIGTNLNDLGACFWKEE